jgi:LytS/YehU family sensor histidine kinase
MKRSTVYWLCQIGGWGLFCSIYTAFSVFYTHKWQFFVMYAWGGVSAVGCTHALRAYIHKRGWLKVTAGRLVPRVLAASIIVGLAITLLVSASSFPLLGTRYTLSTWQMWFPPAVMNWTMDVLLWCAIYFLAHVFFQRAELTALAKDAQLRALLSQVNPHFIFNCLNSLRALIVEDPERAQNMVTQLAEILRYSLQSSATETVTLQAELDAVNSYLKLEAVRLEERLHVTMDIQPDSLNARVPPMIVQTLVENGIKHGIATLPQGGELRVTSQVETGTLHLRVTNSGQMGEAAKSTQIGLENARKRLKLMYGDDASLRIGNDGPGLVLAEVSLPV